MSTDVTVNVAEERLIPFIEPEQTDSCLSLEKYDPILPGPSALLSLEIDPHLPGQSSHSSPGNDPHLPGPSSRTDDFSSGSSDLWVPPNTEQTDNEADASEESQNESDDDIPLSRIANAARKRKKGVGPMQRKLRQSRSESRKKGEAYITAKGKSILAKTSRPVSESCRAKCHEKTANIDLKQVFADYRSLPSRDIQKRYLASLITIKPKERTRCAAAKDRQITVLYKLDGINGNICKKCFLNVFGESRGFLDDVVKKKKRSPTSIILKSDLRGSLPSGNKRSEADISFARDFINSFPAYESHYSRNHTTKRYLAQDLNLQILYTLYKEKFESTRSDPTTKPLSLSVFRNVFITLNLKFKKPSNDTCKTCDAFSLKLKCSVDEEEKSQIKNESKRHQDKASFHYATKRDDKEKSRQSLGRIIVAAFDLQKCLATPNLTASVSFYKRKLWTFNLTIRNITTKKTSCYIWHEGVAQRGADEIASCLFQFIKDLPDHVETLILYSDTCPGQNRNSILPIMFSKALDDKNNLKEIHHKFLVPGHTHLECDTDHATIERFVKKRNPIISVPQDWVSVVKMSSSHFYVKFMRQTDFFGFSKLLATHFVKRNIAKDKLSFAWNSIFWICYKKDEDIGFKYTLNPDEPFRFFSMLRRGRSFSMSNIEIPPAYNEPLIIDILKYKDILDLLPYIDPIYHGFYKTLKNSQPRTPQYVSDSDENFDE